VRERRRSLAEAAEAAKEKEESAPGSPSKYQQRALERAERDKEASRKRVEIYAINKLKRAYHELMFQRWMAVLADQREAEHDLLTLSRPSSAAPARLLPAVPTASSSEPDSPLVDVGGELLPSDEDEGRLAMGASTNTTIA
jgi:hypothetical protein